MLAGVGAREVFAHTDLVTNEPVMLRPTTHLSRIGYSRKSGTRPLGVAKLTVRGGNGILSPSPIGINMTVPLSKTFAQTILRSVFVLLLTLILSLLHAPLITVHAAVGGLDPTFGNGGKVTTDLGALDEIDGLAIQADGKIVATGFSSTFTESKFIVCRYNNNGNLDANFGTNGVVNTVFGVSANGNQLGNAEAVIIQPDGKIVAGGSAATGFHYYFALARYNSDGSLDTSFGEGGKVLTSFLGAEDAVRCLAIQADGKILAAGTVHTGGSGFDFGMARYNRNGTLDDTFGSGGKVTTGFDSVAGQPSADGARDIAVQHDGKIVLVGDESGNGSSFREFAIARYDTNGSLDATFGSGGKVTTDFFGGDDSARAVALQQDGKLLVGGFETRNRSFTQDFALVRYNTNGSLDPAFGVGGKVTTDFTTDFSTVVRSDDAIVGLAIQPDGKIVAGGTASSFIGFGGFALARYDTNGLLDSGFGTGGKVTTSFNGLGESAASLATQPDGKLVLGGNSETNPAGNSADFALARYEGTSFDICIQDDSNGSLLQFNSTTGQYVFTNCAGLVVGGTGALVKKGNLITLQHNAPDRRLTARLDLSTNASTVTLQLLTQGNTLFISDRNIRNNTCACR